MNIEYYFEYLHFKSIGIKPKIKEAIKKFIESFKNDSEKESWTIEYLPKLEFDSNGRIRNELFEEIIFPVLWNGYKNKNVSLMIWLVKLEQNYYQNTNIMKSMGYKSSNQIIRECYEIDPNNEEIIDLFLELELKWISYATHEWTDEFPYILVGNDGATKEECKKLLENISFLHKLDRNKGYSKYINEYEKKIKQNIKMFK